MGFSADQSFSFEEANLGDRDIWELSTQFTEDFANAEIRACWNAHEFPFPEKYVNRYLPICNSSPTTSLSSVIDWELT